MGSISKDHWDVAFHRCRSRLTEDECRRIEGVASFDTLRDAIEDLKEKHKQGLFYRCLRRLEPFLSNVQSLAGAVDVFAQAKPEIMSLLWGSLRLALELVVRHANAMEHMTNPGPKPSGLRTFTLHGIGGVGKTATAVQYAHKFKGTYLTVIWVPAESSARLLQALNQAARDLGAATEQNKPEEAREALINRLQQDDQPWLLVFDNVEDVSTLNGCWPASGIGSVLVTSRDAESSHSLTNGGFKITSFDKKAGATSLIQNLAGVDGTLAGNIRLAEQISQKMGGLALGLKQMSSFMREPSCSMEEFLDLWQDKASQQTLFENGAQSVKLGFFQAIRQLTHYALISQEQAGSLSIHRLVQATEILRMTPREGHPRSKETSNTLFPRWEKCAKYASHIDNLALMLPEWSLKPIPEDHFFDIVFESSWYLLETGDMARCEEVSHFAESLCDLSSAQGQIDLSYIYNSYGIIGFQHDKIEESLNWFEKARKLRVDNLGPN
ncbi:hypothetical protein QQX98_012874 [Neonectria punicea]|uniref:NB-ARC domain-containing protein n=1 Tax=Neonectria punicea TaxID=979145 RepID=A0ABR1GI21_9HYPO